MTGVGKTDLVRRLVKALDRQDRFCEVELSNGDSTSYWSSVGNVLDGNYVNDEEPKIVLFDEIQRFNTLDVDSKPLANTKFTDFWELLSDGRLAKRNRDDTLAVLTGYSVWLSDARKRRDKGEVVDLDEPIGFWDGSSLRKMPGLPEDPEVLAGLSRQDIDADIFHAFTEKISVVEIKAALTRRFKPEQVARFGNIHLIYTSLRRADFEEFIGREIKRVVETEKKTFGVTVAIDRSINELVYRNGAFPVSGVRPVLSSVIDIVESNLSRLMFEALMTDQKRIQLGYDADTQSLVAKLGKDVRIDLLSVGGSTRSANATSVTWWPM